MDTKQKLINIAKRYLVEDDEIIFKPVFDKAIKIYQKDNKIIVEEIR